MGLAERCGDKAFRCAWLSWLDLVLRDDPAAVDVFDRVGFLVVRRRSPLNQLASRAAPRFGVPGFARVHNGMARGVQRDVSDTERRLHICPRPALRTQLL